jgi:hypothetical protein
VLPPVVTELLFIFQDRLEGELLEGVVITTALAAFFPLGIILLVEGNLNL